MRAKTAKELQDFRNWGFTNDPEDRDAVLAFRNAALADGWTEKDATGEHFQKEGFVAYILVRKGGPNDRYAFTAIVHLWGPDGLAIEPPEVYSWEKIRAGLTRCHYCGATGVPTERVSFAGRCCAACLPAVRAQLERPGWYD